MTGGRSTHNSGKKWEEKDVQGSVLPLFVLDWLFIRFLGLNRLRDSLIVQLGELQKSKSKGKTDESLISEISRLESAITVTRDDLVGTVSNLIMLSVDLFCMCVECLQVEVERSSRRE